jgi:hypothetical protein
MGDEGTTHTRVNSRALETLVSQKKIANSRKTLSGKKNPYKILGN